MKNNTLYELTRFEEMPKAIPLTSMHPQMYSCPTCKSPQIVDTKRDVKCPNCGMLFRI